MKHLLCLWALFLFPLSSAFSHNPTDSLIEVRLKGMEQRYAKRADSLGRELAREVNTYKVKEEFFVTSFAGQGTLYSVLMGVIATLILAVGYKIFSRDVIQLKEEFEKRIKELNDKNKELLEQMNEAHFKFHSNELTRHMEACNESAHESNYGKSIYSYIMAIYTLLEINKYNDTKEDRFSKEEIIDNINRVFKQAGKVLLIISHDIQEGNLEKIQKALVYDLNNTLLDENLDNQVILFGNSTIVKDYFIFKQQVLSVFKKAQDFIKKQSNEEKKNTIKSTEQNKKSD